MLKKIFNARKKRLLKKNENCNDNQDDSTADMDKPILVVSYTGNKYNANDKIKRYQCIEVHALLNSADVIEASKTQGISYKQDDIENFVCAIWENDRLLYLYYESFKDAYDISIWTTVYEDKKTIYYITERITTDEAIKKYGDKCSSEGLSKLENILALYSDEDSRYEKYIFDIMNRSRFICHARSNGDRASLNYYAPSRTYYFAVHYYRNSHGTTEIEPRFDSCDLEEALRIVTDRHLYDECTLIQKLMSDSQKEDDDNK